MRVERADNTNFQGKLIIMNKFSGKPQLCINKTKENLEKLVKPKDYNVYINQDFSRNVINIVSDSMHPLISGTKNKIQKTLNITSKPSAYLAAVKENMDEYEAYMAEKFEKNWSKAQKRSERKEAIELIVYAPLMLALMLVDTIFPNGGDETLKFINKIAKKFVTKKG